MDSAIILAFSNDGEVWDQEVGNGSWNLNFVRAFIDWELDMLENLLSDL